jgi:hypothetical protein
MMATATPWLITDSARLALLDTFCAHLVALMAADGNRSDHDHM